MQFLVLVSYKASPKGKSKNQQTKNCILKGTDGTVNEAIFMTNYLIRNQELPKDLRTSMAEKPEIGSLEEHT